MKNVCVWCVDDRLHANLMCLSSVLSCMRNTKKSDFVLMMSENNPYKVLYSRVENLKLMFVDEQLGRLGITDQFDTENKKRIGSFTFLRFLLFDAEMFARYDSILYLDIDTYVNRGLDDNIIKLVNGTDKLIYVVPEKSDARKKQLIRQIEEKMNIKTDFSVYFNAGVFGINRRVLVERYPKVFDRLRSMIRCEFDLMDQDIMNILFRHDLYAIKSKYNYSIVTERKKLKDPVITHFVGSLRKPETLSMLSKSYCQLAKL